MVTSAAVPTTRSATAIAALSRTSGLRATASLRLASVHRDDRVRRARRTGSSGHQRLRCRVASTRPMMRRTCCSRSGARSSSVPDPVAHEPVHLVIAVEPGSGHRIDSGRLHDASARGPQRLVPPSHASWTGRASASRAARISASARCRRDLTVPMGTPTTDADLLQRQVEVVMQHEDRRGGPSRGVGSRARAGRGR